MPRITQITVVLAALLLGVVSGLSAATSSSHFLGWCPSVHEAPAEPVDVSLAPAVLVEEPSEALVAEVVPDPYEGYSSWCAPLVRQDCETHADCPADPFHGNAPQRCVHPWWAKDDPDYRVCAIGYTGPRERRYRRKQIELVAKDRCNGKKECNGDVAKILLLEAWKESTFRPYVRHRLNPDLEANDKAWTIYASRYGHETRYETRKWRNRQRKLIEGQVAVGVTMKPDGNRHYAKQWRWATGLGLYGMVASGFAFEWDPQAPPEALCRIEIATEVWLRRARQVWPKIAHGLDCDHDGEKDFWGSATDPEGRPLDEPSWYDLHNAVNVGRLCPLGASRRALFEARAAKLDLDPYGPVRLTDLGTPVSPENQAEWARAMQDRLADMDSPWDD